MKVSDDQLYMVFDVESIGLHGEGFAVGFVVVNGFGNEIQHGLIACPPNAAEGLPDSRFWVSKNIPAIKSQFKCSDPKEVRHVFWEAFQIWKARGAILLTDCGWPVEARFLADCVRDNPGEREFSGPYPLHDIASVLLISGLDPLKKYPRKANELPEHNPLADAYQSARLFCECLDNRKEGSEKQ